MFSFTFRARERSGLHNRLKSERLLQRLKQPPPPPLPIKRPTKGIGVYGGLIGIRHNEPAETLKINLLKEVIEDSGTDLKLA